MDGNFDDNFDDVLKRAGDVFGYKPTMPKPQNITADISGILNKMRGGTSGQESGGDTKAVNPDSGALGEFQVMPANVPAWTEKWYKRRLSPEEFKNNPEAQRIVFDGEMGSYLRNSLKRAKGDEDLAVRMAAASWYGGEGNANLYDDPKPQFYNGKKYPSFREYTTKVLNRSKGAKSSGDLTDISDYSTQLKDANKLFAVNSQTEEMPDYADLLGQANQLFGVNNSATFQEKPFGGDITGINKSPRREKTNPVDIVPEVINPQTELDVIESSEKLPLSNLPKTEDVMKLLPPQPIPAPNGREPLPEDYKEFLQYSNLTDSDESKNLYSKTVVEPLAATEQKQNAEFQKQAANYNQSLTAQTVPNNQSAVNDIQVRAVANTPNVRYEKPTNENLKIGLADSFSFEITAPKGRQITPQEAIKSAYNSLPENVKAADQAYRQITGNSLWDDENADYLAWADNEIKTKGGLRVDRNLDYEMKAVVDSFARGGFDGLKNDLETGNLSGLALGDAKKAQTERNINLLTSEQSLGKDEFQNDIKPRDYNAQYESQMNEKIFRDKDADYDLYRRVQKEMTDARVNDPFSDGKAPTKEEIIERMRLMKSVESDAKALEKIPVFGSLISGAMGGVGRVNHAVGGVARIVTAPFESLIGNGAYKYFRDVGDAAILLEQSTNKDGGIGTQVLKGVGGLPFDAARFVALSRLPGSNVIIGFGVDSGLQSLGRGESSGQIFKETVKGASLGALFKLSGGVANQINSAALKPIARIGTVGAGTYPIELAFGATPEEAFKSALINGLFEVTNNLGSLKGKFVRAWNKGEPRIVKIENDGAVILYEGKSDAPVDLEMVLDPVDNIYKQKSEVENKYQSSEASAPKVEQPFVENPVVKNDALAVRENTLPEQIKEPAPNKTEIVEDSPLYARAKLNDGRDMILHNTKDVKALRAIKNKLTEKGFPKQEVQKFVKENYKKENFADLDGRDNVYLVMPSTSGRNTIPREFAKQLQKDFGGEVVQNFARPLNKKEAKSKSGILKISDPATYEMKSDLSQYASKNIVIVDDVLNTGDTVNGLRNQLKSQGIEETQIAALGTAGIYTTTPRTVERIAQKLAKLTKKDYNEVYENIRPALENQLGQYSHYVETSIKGWSAGKVYDALVKSSQAVRDYGKTVDRIQPESENKSQYARTDIQRSGIPRFEGLAASPDSKRGDLEVSQAELLNNDLVSAIENDFTAAELKAAKISPNGKMNEQAFRLISDAHRVKADSAEPEVFFGSYLNPNNVVGVRSALSKILKIDDPNFTGENRKEAERILSEFDDAVDKTHGDMMQIASSKNVPEGLPEAWQEEGFHRVDYRVGDKHQISAKIFQADPVGREAIENLRKGAYKNESDATLAVEVGAKIHRSDATKELGLTADKVEYLRNKQIDAYIDSGKSLDEIIAAFAEVEEIAQNYGNKQIERPGDRGDQGYSKPIDAGRTRELQTENYRQIQPAREGQTTNLAERPTAAEKLNSFGQKPEGDTSLAKKESADLLYSRPAENAEQSADKPKRSLVSYIWEGRGEDATPKKEIIVNFRRAGLLTGIGTHLRNLSSNGLNQISEEAIRPVALLADLAASAVTGKRTVQPPSLPGIAKSFAALVRADKTMKALDKASAVSRAWNILKTGDIKELDKNQMREMKSGSPAFDAVVNYTFRALGAEDALFKVYTMRRSLEEQAKTLAITEAREQNIKGLKNRFDFVAERRAELLEKPTNEMLLEAELYADFTTFTNDNPISDVFGEIKNAGIGNKNPFVDEAAKLKKSVIEVVVPYDKTPTNIILRTIEHSPLGYGWAAKHLLNLKKGDSYAFRKAREKYESEWESLDKNRTAARASLDGKIIKLLDDGGRLEKQIEDLKNVENRNVAQSKKLLDLEQQLEDRRNGIDRLQKARARRAAKDMFRDQNRAEIEKALEKVFPRVQQQAFARAFGRASMGTTLLALGIYFAMRNVVTGVWDAGEQDEKKEFYRRRDAGIPNGSVKLGDRRYQITDTPQGKILTLGASIYERSLIGQTSPEAIAKQKEILEGMLKSESEAVRKKAQEKLNALNNPNSDKFFTDLADVGGNIIFEQPLLNSLDDYFGSNKTLRQRVSGLLGSFVPTMFANIADVTDDKARETPNKKGDKGDFWDGMQNRTPILRNYNEESDFPREDYLQDRTNRIINTLDPLKSRPVKESENLKEILKDADAQSAVEIFENADEKDQKDLLPVILRKSFATDSVEEKERYEKAVRKYMDVLTAAEGLRKQGVVVEK